jgi:dihydrofolate reductase
MGKLVVTEFVTLDGVAQSPGAPDDDRDGDFDLGGWQAPLLGDEADALFEQAQTMDALLLGRETYEIFAGYWPTAPDEIPFTRLLNAVPKYVASRTLTDPLSWSGTTVVGEPIGESVAALRQRHEEVHVIGSIDLVQSLLRLGLVDRLELWSYPVVLGRGKRLFGDGTVPTALRLTEAVPYPNGVLQLTYDTAGAPTFGTVAG